MEVSEKIGVPQVTMGRTKRMVNIMTWMIWGRSSLDGCDVCCIAYTYDILFFGWMSKIGHEDWCRGWPAASKQSKPQTQTTSSPTVDELVNF